MLIINADFKKMKMGLLEMANIMKEEWPFIISKATNETSKEIVQEIYTEMKRVFHNPTPYTLNSLQTIYGTKQAPEARINFRKMGGKANHYLQAQVYGGGRAQKISEQLLSSERLLGTNKYYAPTKQAPLNSYGNLPSNYLTNIINQSDRGKASKFFIVPNRTKKLSPGVYEYISDDKQLIRKVINFLPSVNYSKLFYFFEKTKKEFDQRIQNNIIKAIKYCKLNPYLKK